MHSKNAAARPPRPGPQKRTCHARKLAFGITVGLGGLGLTVPRDLQIFRGGGGEGRGSIRHQKHPSDMCLKMSKGSLGRELYLSTLVGPQQIGKEGLHGTSNTFGQNEANCGWITVHSEGLPKPQKNACPMILAVDLLDFSADVCRGGAFGQRRLEACSHAAQLSGCSR